MNHISPPVNYPRSRKWRGAMDDEFSSCKTLMGSWQFSTSQLQGVADTLNATLGTHGPIRCIAVAGSYGRMEAAPHSDFDLIVFVQDDEYLTSDRVLQMMQATWQALESLDLQLPKQWGIFVKPTSAQALTQENALGDLNESRDVFGKRIQMLLDCQPVYGETAFTQIQEAIVQWYATAFVRKGQGDQWTYLMNDLIRYYRSYAAWHQFKLTVEHDDSWMIRNAKLRTSRLVMFAGLLLQLGETSRIDGANPHGLLEILRLTPLERLVQLFARYDPRTGDAFLSAYDICFELLNDDDTRRALVTQAPRHLIDLPLDHNDSYESLRQHSGELLRLLTEFTLARQDDFDMRFWQYLLY